MRRWLKQRMRERIKQRPFPASWQAIMNRNVPFAAYLSVDERKELEEDVLIFVREKRFEGAAGLKITDEIKITIAAQACILLLHRKTDYFPGLYSIIVYPYHYLAPQVVRKGHGIMAEGLQARLGESWTRGAIVLSWDDVRRGASDIHDGHNVVLHEFAHQLDAQDGAMNGAPILSHHSMYESWSRVLGGEYERLRRDARLGKGTLLDEYGSTNPAEFFAVATEFFFEKPRQLRQQLPDLYNELSRYYNQDPAELLV